MTCLATIKEKSEQNLNSDINKAPTRASKEASTDAGDFSNFKTITSKTISLLSG